MRQKAIEFATKAHDGQFRKNTGLPYITHPIAVAEQSLILMKNFDWDDRFLDEVYITALLHDTIEDTDVTEEDIRGLFGINVALNVVDLSRKENETYLDFILRVKKGFVTSLVKIADIDHNMSDLKEGSLKDKYRLAKHILQAL